MWLLHYPLLAQPALAQLSPSESKTSRRRSAEPDGKLTKKKSCLCKMKQQSRLRRAAIISKEFPLRQKFGERTKKKKIFFCSPTTNWDSKVLGKVNNMDKIITNCCIKISSTFIPHVGKIYRRYTVCVEAVRKPDPASSPASVLSTDAWDSLDMC